MTTFSAAGGRGLVGVAAFPLQCQWICTMIMFYPAPTDGRYSNGLRCLILLYVFNFKVYVFYILVTLVSVLLRPTTSLLWLILSVPMCIDVTMCMLMLLFYDSCAMLALYVSIKFLLTTKRPELVLSVIVTNYLIEFYFVMIVVTIIGIFMAIIFILNYTSRLPETK